MFETGLFDWQERLQSLDKNVTEVFPFGHVSLLFFLGVIKDTYFATCLLERGTSLH